MIMIICGLIDGFDQTFTIMINSSALSTSKMIDLIDGHRSFRQSDHRDD